MKTTLWAAVAALALAFAPLANAAEGGGDPFPFSAGTLATTTFNADGTVQSAAPRNLAAATRTDAGVGAAASAQGQASSQDLDAE